MTRKRRLMLSSDHVAREFLHIALRPIQQISKYSLSRDQEDLHITHSNHANRLPNAQADTRHHATIQTLQAIILINVLRRVPNRHLLRTVRVLSLTLHFHADNLDRLVPRTQSTTQARREDLLPRIELAALLLASDSPDTLLRQAREAEPRAPVRHLPDRDGVDALVDALDALLAVDVHEGGEGAWRLDACGRQLGLGDLDCLHAGAEAHCCVCLCHAAEDAAADARCEV